MPAPERKLERLPAISSSKAQEIAFQGIPYARVYTSDTQRIYEIAIQEYGLAPEDLVFDALTLPLTTGDPAEANTAKATLLSGQYPVSTSTFSGRRQTSASSPDAAIASRLRASRAGSIY